MKTLDLALIGLGKIAIPQSKQDLEVNPARTHLSAIHQSKNINVKYIFDIDLMKATNSKSHFELLKNSKVLDQDFGSNEQVDIVSICTPPENRFDIIKRSLALKPKYMVLEKPLSLDFKEAKEIEHLLNQHQVTTFVNFPRLIDKDYEKIETMIKDDDSISTSIYKYHKGLENYCSHHLQQFIRWFGLPQKVKAITNVSNPTFILTDKKDRVHHFIGFNNLQFDIFDCEVYCAEKVITLENGGCEKSERIAKDNIYYENYTQLSKKTDLFPNGKVGGFAELYQHIIDNNFKNLCSIKNAIYGEKIIQLVKKSIQNNFEEYEFNVED
ncbi:MAG: Gfo/Idh/MocA family oxidoreductase [Oligoflexia bacterium]|nr:Gfo/Idh/MocA family oxidoreductase [Oligoflexia bacterium]